MNPARELKTERHSRTEGKKPAFVDGEVQKLLNVNRDLHAHGVARPRSARGPCLHLRPDRRRLEPEGRRLLSVRETFLLRFREKGGKEKELPVHHKLEELLDEYLKATGLGDEPGAFLFPTALRNIGKLLLKPRRGSPVTPTAGPPNSRTSAVRRFYSKTWREMPSSAFLSKCRVR
jgi:hypothetical protein